MAEQANAFVLDLTKDGYYRITPDMTPGKIEFHPLDRELTLEELQKGVGGYIEHHVIAVGGLKQRAGGPFGYTFEAVGQEADVFINEEGKLEGLRVNTTASAIMHVLGAIPQTDPIVGTMLIVCGKAREQPETG